jgi:hypothetical protein
METTKMPDKVTLDLIQDLQNQLDIQGAAMKDLFQLYSGTTMLLSVICAQLNPGQSDQIK